MLSNYPPGAEHDPNAPYNQWEPDEREFDVSVSVTIAKKTRLTTNDYSVEYDEEDGRLYYITDDTDWQKSYEDSEPSVLEMLEELKDYIKKELDENKDIDHIRKRKLQYMLDAAEGWDIDEIYICD